MSDFPWSGFSPSVGGDGQITPFANDTACRFSSPSAVSGDRAMVRTSLPAVPGITYKTTFSARLLQGSPGETAPAFGIDYPTIGDLIESFDYDPSGDWKEYTASFTVPYDADPSVDRVLFVYGVWTAKAGEIEVARPLFSVENSINPSIFSREVIGLDGASLMAEGAYGLGAPALRADEFFSSNDFNDFNIPGEYTTTGDFIHGPLSVGIAAHVGLLKVSRRSVGGLITRQEWWGADGSEFMRPSLNSPWVPVYNGNNGLGLVGQSGGMPTGAIFESGSTSDGYFLKMLDGTLYANLGYVTFSLLDNNTIDLPVSFADGGLEEAVVLVTLNTNTGGWEQINDRNRWFANARFSTGGNSIFILGSSAKISGANAFEGAYGSCCIFVIGRWY